MKRVMDVSVALLFVVMCIVTYRSLTREESPAPVPKAAAPAPDPNQGPSGSKEPLREANRRSPEELEETRRWFEADNARLRAEARRITEEESRTQGAPFNGDERLRLEPHRSSGGRDALGSGGSSGGAQVSDVDVKRKAAREKLAQIFQSLGPSGRSLIANVERHLRSCGGVTDGYCAKSLENIGRQAIQVGNQIEYTQELARTSWLPPGEVRALREKHGIDNIIFDQIVRIVNRYAP